MMSDETRSSLLDDLAAHLRQLPAGPPAVVRLSRDADGTGGVEGQASPGDEGVQNSERAAQDARGRS